MNTNCRIQECFNSVNPESAERGDFSEIGSLGYYDGFETIEDVVSFILSKGAYLTSGSEFYTRIWYGTGYSIEDYHNLTETEYTYHVTDDFTDEEKLVIHHLFIIATTAVKNA